RMCLLIAVAEIVPLGHNSCRSVAVLGGWTERKPPVLRGPLRVQVPLLALPARTSSSRSWFTHRRVVSSALNLGSHSVNRDSSPAPARLCRSGTIRDGRRRSLTVAILENAGFSRSHVGFKSPLSHFAFRNAASFHGSGTARPPDGSKSGVRDGSIGWSG